MLNEEALHAQKFCEDFPISFHCLYFLNWLIVEFLLNEKIELNCPYLN